MFNYQNETYLIFLDNKYFKKSLFSSIYEKIKEDLENKGIKTVSIIDIIDFQNTSDNQQKLKFDDKDYPETNVLYIHLFDKQYYTDSIYSKKKIEKERDMLLLIAGKLGVKESSYSVDVTEMRITKANLGTNVQSVDGSIGYQKIITKTKGQTGKEIYLNRGAPVYLNFKTTSDVNNNIKETIGEMQSKVFSYDYYINNSKLESFVHKRFAFKMLRMEYTLEEDDLSDLSFGVKACFFNYGINTEFSETVLNMQKITYVFDFYTDEDLVIKFNQRDLEFSDEFVKMRLTYDKSENKEIAIHHICEYVIDESKKCFFKQNNLKFNFYGILSKWIISRPYDEFIEECKKFYSTTQIRNWIFRTLSDNTMEIIHLDKNNNDIKICLDKIDDKSNLPKATSNTKRLYRMNSYCMDDKDFSDEENDDSFVDSDEENKYIPIISQLEKMLKEVTDEKIKLEKQLETNNQNLTDKSNENQTIKNYIEKLEIENKEIKKNLWGASMQCREAPSNDIHKESQLIKMLEAKLAQANEATNQLQKETELIIRDLSQKLENTKGENLALKDEIKLLNNILNNKFTEI